jgi:hypothetical protein
VPATARASSSAPPRRASSGVVAPPPGRRVGPPAHGDSESLALAIPERLIDQLVERVADRLAERQGFEDGWLRGADRIAAYIDCKPDRVYALTSAKRIPVERDGSALIARRSQLDAWIRSGGGKRP